MIRHRVVEIAEEALGYISPYLYPDETADERDNAYRALQEIIDYMTRSNDELPL